MTDPKDNPFLQGVDTSLSNDLDKVSETVSVAKEGVPGAEANTVAAGQVPPATPLAPDPSVPRTPQGKVLASDAIPANTDQEASSQAQGHQPVINPNPNAVGVSPAKEAENQRDGHANPSDLQQNARLAAEAAAAEVTGGAIGSTDVFGRQPGNPNDPIDIPPEVQRGLARPASPNFLTGDLDEAALLKAGYVRTTEHPIIRGGPGQPPGPVVTNNPLEIQEVVVPPRPPSKATLAEMEAGRNTIMQHQPNVVVPTPTGEKTVSSKTAAELEAGQKALADRTP